MKTRLLGVAIASVVLAAAPLAFGQDKSSDTSASMPPAADDSGDASQKKELPATPPDPVSSSSDTLEDPIKSYQFVGLRYRGTVIPQFMINMFANGGATFYSNMVGAELDIRKDGHSTMPWIAFANYGFGDTLFESAGSNGTGPEIPGNWTVVNSSLNAFYLGVDELWSAPLDNNHHWDFEYGFGVGLGVVFGDLGNNWVYQDANGPYHSNGYGNYSLCQTVNDGNGCALAQHPGAQTAKVGGYKEKAGLLGPKPIIFPYLAVPELGIRFKPVKQFESRLDVGFSLTGFWFGLSVDYGLEKTRETSTGTSSLRPQGML